MAMVDRQLLPNGIEEVLPLETARIEAARRQVLDLFHRWGYEFVVTPCIGHLGSLLTGAGQGLDLHTFKVTDLASSRLTGFRADITPQIARMDAHSLRREGPNRLCYAGSVLHAQPRALFTSRSPIQLGAELYSDPSPASDVEMINLMLEIFEVAEAPDIHIGLDHVGIYHGLARAAGLSDEVEQQLFNVLQCKAVDEVEALTADLPAELRGMSRALTELCGGRDALGQGHARLAAAPADVQVALNELIEITDSLAGRFPGLPLYFNLGELRGYHYHTGMVFATFVPSVDQSITQGDRYDGIGADLGRTRPATSSSTDLESLVILSQTRLDQVVSGIWAPAEGAGLQQAIQRLRRGGQRVVQVLPGQDAASAHEAGCDRQLALCDDNWQVAPLAS